MYKGNTCTWLNRSDMIITCTHVHVHVCIKHVINASIIIRVSL